MVVKEEQERVRALLADTITLLCRNGLTYKSEFNISALIGITLDKEDVLLVDIRETIKNNIEEENAAESSAESEEESPPSKRQRKRRKRKRSQNSNEEISLADKQFEPVNLKTELSEQDEDDIVFIKDEPGDSLDSSMDNSHHYKGQLQQQSFMSHYGNMSGTIAMPGTVNMSWDQSSQQQQQQQNQSLLANASASNISTAAQEGGPFQCEMCSRVYQWRKSYIKHMKETHLGIYTCSCPVCGRGFGATRDLTSHIKSHHPSYQDPGALGDVLQRGISATAAAVAVSQSMAKSQSAQSGSQPGSHSGFQSPLQSGSRNLDTTASLQSQGTPMHSPAPHPSYSVT